MTRVAFFMPDLVGGGAERVTLDLCRELEARGHSVSLLLGRDEGALRSADGAAFPFEVTDLRSRRTLLAAWPLATWLARRRPDVLVAVLAHAGLVATLARALARSQVPLVVIQHNTMSINARHSARSRDRLLPHLFRLAYRRRHTLVAVSQGVANDLARVTGVRRDRIAVLPNPVDHARIRELGATGTVQPADPTVAQLVAVGRLVPQKDYVTLLRAAAELAFPFRLTILGEGPERPRLERTITDLGLEGRVCLPGFVPNPYPQVRAADVLVMSSRWEGLPTVLLEALAFETRIVSTDCASGPREILDGGTYGSLVPVGDHRALAEAIGTQLTDHAPADRTDVRRRYDAAAAVDQFEAFLDGVLSRVDP